MVAQGSRALAWLFACACLLPVACAGPLAGSARGQASGLSSESQTNPESQPPTPERRSRIVDRTTGWPRFVEDPSGRVTIPMKPMRIHTLSVGYDEVTFRLVDPSRIIAVGQSTANPELSNVSAEARAIPNRVGRNAEEVVALQPDLVVASPFSNRDLVEHLRAARIPLVLADLVSSVDAHAENVRFLAYLYGEEERGEALIAEVSEQLQRLQRVVAGQGAQPSPRVLLFSGTTAAGGGTNEDGLLRLAGARNAAAEAGIAGHREIGVEGLHTIDPDVIVIAVSSADRPSSAEALVQNPALAGVRAIRDGRVLRIKWSLLTTLSHWNVVGAEELARGLHPDAARVFPATAPLP
jgi:iron complex transport system substrate-binding protein